MGKVILTGSGSVGSGSQECTSTKAEVLRGYTAITGDSDDEVVEGSLELIGDAADSQVLAGKTFYNTNPKFQRTGSMVNHGAISQMLTAGGSYTIPAGYHNGSGKVMAGSLASQTYGTATAAQILSGQTVWVNGNKLIGTMAVQSILSFNAAVYSSTAIAFTWKNPVIGPFSGVIIVGKTGSYPTSITDGTRYYIGTGNNTTSYGISIATVSSFSGGTTYYFRAFSYAIKDGYEWIPATTYTAAVSTTKGQQVITSSQSFTVPSGVRSLDIFCVGGGGAGGLGDDLPVDIPRNLSYYGGSGGSGGFTKTQKNIPVTPGESLSIVIGAGGTGYTTYGGAGDGGATSVARSSTILISAPGGGGAGPTLYGGNGGNGGSGGGMGAEAARGYGDVTTRGATNGGSNGASSSGTGQGFTTSAFGEPSGTIYAGAGGGGGMLKSNSSIYMNGGAGGSGGGGRGGNQDPAEMKGVPGSANTGGGGGGGIALLLHGESGGSGGSGICIIRWGY